MYPDEIPMPTLPQQLTEPSVKTAHEREDPRERDATPLCVQERYLLSWLHSHGEAGTVPQLAERYRLTDIIWTGSYLSIYHPSPI